MFRTRYPTILLIALGLLLTACQAETIPPVSYDPSRLQFSGERALEIETQFVT